MAFRNEDAKNLEKEGSLAHRDIGNLTQKTEVMFEYDPKPKETIKQEEIDLSKMSSLPFQATLVYTAQNGNRLIRVVSGQQGIGKTEEEANRDLNYGMLGIRAQYHQVSLSKQNNFDKAEAYSLEFGKFMKDNMPFQKEKEQKKFQAWSLKNAQVAKANKKRSTRTLTKIISRMDSDSENELYNQNLNLCSSDLEEELV